MITKLSSLQDPQTILDQFHSFHDAFIHELHLRSKDEAIDNGGQTITGEFDVELTIANVEFQDRSYTQKNSVRISFKSVRTISFHSGGVEGYEWPISKFFLTVAERKNCFCPSQDNEYCFELKILSDRYNKITNCWEQRNHELLSFSFIEAEFETI